MFSHPNCHPDPFASCHSEEAERLKNLLFSSFLPLGLRASTHQDRLREGSKKDKEILRHAQNDSKTNDCLKVRVLRAEDSLVVNFIPVMPTHKGESYTPPLFQPDQNRTMPWLW